ncbi:MAG: hypothetical protein Q8R92_18360 [Deltaproteobacteria bacterium]|nr:hypothetical protein [Deltaproteobacteria bacterium]
MAWLYVLAGFGLIGFLAFLFWDAIKGSRLVKDSETLFLAKLLDGIGILLITLAAADFTPLFLALGIPQWSGVGALFLGIVTEMARRSRATDLK